MDSKDSVRMTMGEAAAYLGHCYSWIHANHHTLGLKGYRIGGRWYFDQADLDLWIRDAKASSHVKRYPHARESKKGRVRF